MDLKEELKNKYKSRYKSKYKNRYRLKPKELFIKTIILRIISSIVTAGMVFFLTGSLEISRIIFVVDFIIKTIVYYIYEYTWFKARKLWAYKPTMSQDEKK